MHSRCALGLVTNSRCELGLGVTPPGVLAGVNDKSCHQKSIEKSIFDISVFLKWNSFFEFIAKATLLIYQNQKNFYFLMY